jgi:hypothetical protein
MKKTKAGSNERAALSAAVLEGMHSGLSAFKACQAAGLNQSTFNLWLNDDAELAAKYAQARENLIERMASDILDISDADVDVLHDGKKDWAAIQKHKLQVDTRKWLLSKLAPRKYGDRIEVAGDADSPLMHRIERVIVKK